jgi:hypothetical protein
MLKICLYGYLNRIHSSRRLERETQLNFELMWLTGRLMPDFKTIPNIRKNNSEVIKRWMGLAQFLTRRLTGVGAEMRLNELAYNLKWVMTILRTRGPMQAILA